MQDAITQYWNTPNMSADTFIGKVIAAMRERRTERGSPSGPAARRPPPGLNFSTGRPAMATISIEFLRPQRRRRRQGRRRPRTRLPAALALLPTALVVLVVYIGCMLWTVRLSFTSSTLLPRLDWVGLTQYSRLFANDRFVTSAENIVIFGALFISGCLILGFLLAVFIDQNVRGESVFRTIFLYPYAMSFVVTGVAWQWFLNPGLGLQKLVRDMGFENFTFDWLVNQDMAIYTIVIAGLWHGSGLTMAILLAGLRGVDEDLWKAARVDGIPTWRYYLPSSCRCSGP